MNWIRTIFGEVLGLFVEDAVFAGAIVAWLLLVVLATPGLMPALGLGAGWTGAILFGGLAAILVESVIRRAR